MNRIVIGIAGGTGSGKTTVAQALYKAFPGDAVILSHDYYYKPHESLTYEERSRVNYDHPDSLDTDLMVEHVRALKAGHSIHHPNYDFSTYHRFEQLVPMDSARIIIIEGILLFTSKELCDLCDVKLFVDTDSDVRFIRRLSRDVKERARSMDSVVSQYLNTVKPMHEQFVEPTKAKANLIIPEGGHNTIALSMIIDGIKKRLVEDKE